MAQSEIRRLQKNLDAINVERVDAERAAREEARSLRKQRDDLYQKAVEKGNAIVRPAIADGQIVMVYDPSLLDEETLDTLEFMGTPVPPIDEMYPNGVTFADERKGGR